MLHRSVDSGRPVFRLAEYPCRMPEPPSIPPFAFVEVTPRLLSGRAPLTTDQVAELRQRGVTHVLDLREPVEWTAPRRLGAEAIRSMEETGLSHLNIPIKDVEAP